MTDEEDLRRQLRTLAQNLKRREPLKPTYKHLLTDGIVTTSRKPNLPRDKFYRRISSGLRTTVESFAVEMEGKDPFDRIAQRKPLDDEKLRTALTLREFKEHEQTPLLEATLAAMMSVRRPTRPGGPVMDEMNRRKYLEGVALGLQSTKKPRKLTPISPPAAKGAGSALSDLDQKRQEARKREESRQQKMKEEEENRKRPRQRQDDNPRATSKSKTAAAAPPETPMQALHKFYQPVFKLLWDMEFTYLGNTNPFRMVIDRENCAALGAPDYFDIIEKPMNLTYIQRKVEAVSYQSFPEFSHDVDLMLQNAIKYNSDPQNPYRIAAEEMQKKYKKVLKRTVQSFQQKYANVGK